MFYSLQSYTEDHQTVIMTYSPDALPKTGQHKVGRLVLWADAGHNRVTVSTRAFFRKYRPRKGLCTDTSCLGEMCAVVMHLPQKHMGLLVWRADSLDVSQSIVNILMETRGTLLSLAAYTLELELDIIEAASMAEQPIPMEPPSPPVTV